MSGKLYAFRLDPDQDAGLIEQLDSQPRGKRSDFIRDALRNYVSFNPNAELMEALVRIVQFLAQRGIASQGEIAQEIGISAALLDDLAGQVRTYE